MASQKSQGSGRNIGSQSAPPGRVEQLQQQGGEEARAEQERRDEENKTRFLTPFPGVEASDLPDGGRDGVETIREWEAARNLPHQHGGSEESNHDGGMRGDREISDADDHGGRKHN